MPSAYTAPCLEEADAAKVSDALQNRLQGQMADLGSRWHGNASTAFQNGYRAFDSEFEKVKQGLDSIHVSLVQTQREYGVREAETQATDNQIAGLNG